MELSPLKKTIYAIAVLGFLSCLFIPDYSLIAIGLFIIVLIPSWFMVLKKEPFAGYTRAWNIASILFLFFTLAILLLRLKPTHIIFTYQISFLQVSKAFNRKRPARYSLDVVLCLSYVINCGDIHQESPFSRRPVFLSCLHDLCAFLAWGLQRFGIHGASSFQFLKNLNSLDSYAESGRTFRREQSKIFKGFAPFYAVCQCPICCFNISHIFDYSAHNAQRVFIFIFCLQRF